MGLYLIRKDEILQPTRASILLFGSPAAIHQMLPRPTLGVQWIPSKLGEPLPEIRWLDRKVFEDNLIITWRGLITSIAVIGIDKHGNESKVFII